MYFVHSFVFFKMGNTIVNFNFIIHDSEEDPECENYLKESERLKTFDTWKHPYPKPADLSESGFIYTQINDLVRCVFCDVEIHRWQKEDNVMEEHLKFSPMCRFLCHEDVKNVPVNAKELKKRLPPAPSCDDCGTGKNSPATERLERELMREYAQKYGYILSRTETDGKISFTRQFSA